MPEVRYDSTSPVYCHEDRKNGGAGKEALDVLILGVREEGKTEEVVAEHSTAKDEPSTFHILKVQMLTS